MEPREQIKAVVTYLEGQMKAGQTPEQKETILQNELGRITKESITFSTLAGLTRQGTANMEAWGAKLKDAPADAVQRAILDDRTSDAGRVRQAEAFKAAQETYAGARNAEIEVRKTEAEAELTRERRFEEPHVLEDWARGALGIGRTTAREQLINERAIARAQQRVGIDRPTALLTEEEQALKFETTLPPGTAQYRADEALQQLVAYEKKKAERAAKEAAAQTAEPGKPLVVPQPQGGGVSTP
jgi:hypothetical protein